MNVAVKLAAVAFVGMPVVGMAQNESGLSCIKDVVYSQEFLARYPNAGAACREVVMKDGQKWARFDADVVRVRGNQVTADFIDNHKRSVGTLTFNAAPEARVMVDGREKRFSTLRSGDILSFWMPESRMGFYAEPGASEVEKLAVVSEPPNQG